MGDHPLRPPTDRSLGGPLPRQQANRERADLSAAPLRAPLTGKTDVLPALCGISTCFQVLSPTVRHITHPLLTSSPLYSRDCSLFLVRLACLIHAANVRSEPGSNSPYGYLIYYFLQINTELNSVDKNLLTNLIYARYSLFKEH